MIVSSAAAIERGDVERVSVFLRQLFPRGAQQAGAELRCMRRAMSLLDSRWKAEINKKRKATFASEDKVILPVLHTCSSVRLLQGLISEPRLRFPMFFRALWQV